MTGPEETPGYIGYNKKPYGFELEQGKKTLLNLIEEQNDKQNSILKAESGLYGHDTIDTVRLEDGTEIPLIATHDEGGNPLPYVPEDINSASFYEYKDGAPKEMPPEQSGGGY